MVKLGSVVVLSGAIAATIAVIFFKQNKK